MRLARECDREPPRNAGSTIVVSAGNDGDFATAIPGVQFRRNSRNGALRDHRRRTTNSHILYQSVQIPWRRKFAALFGDGPRPETPLTAPLRTSRSSG